MGQVSLENRSPGGERRRWWYSRSAAKYQLLAKILRLEIRLLGRIVKLNVR